jgi:hypothetical protein
MATGRTYRIKKSAVKAYGYTKPPAKRKGGAARRGPRYAANGSVTHIAAINGRGSYRSARSAQAGRSPAARKKRASTALTHAKKQAFAKRMRALKKNGSARRASAPRSISAKKFRVKRRLPGYSANSMSASERSRRKKAFEYAKAHRSPRKAVPKYEYAPFDSKRFADRMKKSKAKKKSRRKKAASTATRKAIMARKTRRKKSAARKPVARRAKRRVKRRKSAKRSAVAPKRRKRRKARKSVAKAPKRTRRRRKAKALKANPRRRRRLRRNSGTSAGARKGWRTRKARRAGPKRRRVSRKRRSGGKRRKLSMRKSAVAARRRRRALARGGAAPKRRRRRSRRKLTANRKHRSSRRLRSNKRRTRRASPRRRVSRRRMSSNRRSRRSHRRVSHRRHRRNGRRRMFRKNGVMEPILFVLKTGGLALGGFLAHKVLTNALVNYGFSHIFGAPAVVAPVAVPATATTPATTVPVVTAPATAGLGLISLDPAYQKLIAGGLVAALGVFATSKLVKDPTTRNTIATGIAVSFTTTLLTAALVKFAPQYAGLLAGPDDGTAARLSAMYGFGGTSIQPRYAAINGMRGMGEYFQSGVSGLGEYFQSGVNGLGEYFQSGVSGLGALPSYEANAGYGANPDLMEAAAGMGARENMNSGHVDPHGDLDRELTIAEAAAGVGAYEAAAGYGSISTVPSSSTWIPGMSNGQLWAGTRSISNGQSATEMVPAGILQTDGGQGVFG